MPESSFSDDEMERLVGAMLHEGGRGVVERLLDSCHEFTSSTDPTGRWLMPYEKYFRKEMTYHGFDMHIPHFLCQGDSVVSADVQFKRSCSFPGGLWSRHRWLFRKLRRWLREGFRERGIEVRGDEGSRQVHFRVSSEPAMWSASTSFDEWRSEGAVYDEPFSSGQTDPELTEIRNDFVILRIRRR
jgi:hypothetical protein